MTLLHRIDMILENFMAITVRNNTEQRIEVSINHWGDSGNTDRVKIEASGEETWKRSDRRGFVMSVYQNGGSSPYYVFAESSVIVSDTQVSRDGEVLSPLN